MTDNGPQFSSSELAKFGKQYCFVHTTSSPHYPASNGHAERAVKTIKHLIKNTEDPFLALLSYRATPLPRCGKSPSELLMGRRIRTTLPQTSESLVPQWSYLQEFREDNNRFKQRQKSDYDRRHCVRDLPAIPDETEVYVTTNDNPTTGTTLARANAPRSYVIRTPSDQIRRNRSQLNIRPSTTRPQTEHTQDRSPIMTRSRTGTVINPPDRLT